MDRDSANTKSRRGVQTYRVGGSHLEGLCIHHEQQVMVHHHHAQRIAQLQTGEGGVNHRWVLPVLHYPSNLVIYHYPPFWVILMVILLIFIR